MSASGVRGLVQWEMRKHLSCLILMASVAAACTGDDAGGFAALGAIAGFKSPVSPDGGYDRVAVSRNHLYASADKIHIYDVKDGADATELGVFDAQVSFVAVRGNTLFYGM